MIQSRGRSDYAAGGRPPTFNGRGAPKPFRDVKPFTSPPPEARGFSYDVVQRVLATMSDQGSVMVKGKPRAGASAAKAGVACWPSPGCDPAC